MFFPDLKKSFLLSCQQLGKIYLGEQGWNIYFFFLSDPPNSETLSEYSYFHSVCNSTQLEALTTLICFVWNVLYLREMYINSDMTRQLQENCLEKSTWYFAYKIPVMQS